MMQRDREHDADADCGQKPGWFKLSHRARLINLIPRLSRNALHNDYLAM
jgi:hypothetical protein